MQTLRFLLAFVLSTVTSVSIAVGTSFTYQGELQFSQAAADGSFDFEFDLYDASENGVLIGSTVAVDAVTISDGIFSVQLDFGMGAFDGEDRWLEIRVRQSADSEFTLLSPRQMVSPAPYAIKADSAVVADGAVMASSADSVPFSGVTGVPADLADGDDDALSSLACTNGQVPVFDGSNWLCSTPADSDTLAALSCSNGQVPTFDGSNWLCGSPADSDTLAALSCAAGQIASFEGGIWQCRSPNAGAAVEVCVTASGSSGLILDGVCLLGYDNSQSTNWSTATSSCAVLGGDLCSVSQYQALRNTGETLFYNTRPVWSNDFSDDDANVKNFALQSSDDPSVSQTYSYACCGNVLSEPTRSRAENVNGVLATYIQDRADTTFTAAARVCHSQGADLCTKSQYVALNDAGKFTGSVARWTSEMSDNDAATFTSIIGNGADNPSSTATQAYACCGGPRPVDLSCSGTKIGGVCVLDIRDTEDSTFFDAARACTAQGADVCSKSQMQVIRDAGQFSGACWTNDGADNDLVRAGGLLSSQPDNPDPAVDTMGYACCH